MEEDVEAEDDENTVLHFDSVGEGEEGSEEEDVEHLNDVCLRRALRTQTFVLFITLHS